VVQQQVLLGVKVPRVEVVAVELVTVATAAPAAELAVEVALAEVVLEAAVVPELALQAERISRRTMAPVELLRWNSIPSKENTSRRKARRIWI
jgi:hypothetical protein